MASGTIDALYPPIQLPAYSGNTGLSYIVAYAISNLTDQNKKQLLVFRCDQPSGYTSNEVFSSSSFTCMCCFSSSNYGYGILVSDHPRNFASFYVNSGTAYYNYGPTTSLTITRTTDTDYITASEIGKLFAYKKNGWLYLKGNLNLSAHSANSDYTQFATIDGWSAKDVVYVCAPKQTGGTMQYAYITISSSGAISVYLPIAITSGFFRFFACVPEA